MTSEMRTTIEPGDIAAVELECKSCLSRTIRPIGLALQGAEKCPNCSAVWPVQLANELNQIEILGSMLSAVSKFKTNKAIPFTIRFELSEPLRKDSR
jgi:hypothetical protein